MNIYCTYLTIYLGNKLPPFYIGSSTIDRIKSGYRGSVSSKKYKNIWESELKQNPHLFQTKIITTHKTSTEARQKELFFHESLNVVKSDMYINLSVARQKGFFGMDVSGTNNPRYGYKWGDEHPKGMLGKKHSDETKTKWSNSRKGSIPWNLGKKSPEHSQYMKSKMIGNSYAKGIIYPKCSCIVCGKVISSTTLSRHTLLHT
jgi:hypothetical protein